MKKTYLSLIALLCGLSSSYAQWSTPDASGRIFYSGGNVGIGTATPTSQFNVSTFNNSFKEGITVDDVAIGGSAWGAFNTRGNATNIITGAGLTGYGYFSVGASNDNGATSVTRLIIDNTGRTGIGTANPVGKLDVDDGNGTGVITYIGSSSTSGANGLYFSRPISGGIVNIQGTKATVGAENISLQTEGGFVGVGTPTPAYKLDVQSGDARFAGTVYHNSNIVVSGTTFTDGGIASSGTATFSNATHSALFTGGYVGIGTTSPDEKLTVNGTIHATEVKVTVSVFPDYVFKPAYHLPKLSDVKTYIDQNHHLPEVPTEAEVAKNGLNVGQSETLLLKKVEELTLYLIDQQKLLIKQQKEIDKLKRKPAYKKQLK